MKTKSQITADYIDMINQKLNYIKDYQEYIKTKKEEILDLSTGNRGIEEIEEEIQDMESLINNMIDITEDTKLSINNNENNFN